MCPTTCPASSRWSPSGWARHPSTDLPYPTSSSKSRPVPGRTLSDDKGLTAIGPKRYCHGLAGRRAVLAYRALLHPVAFRCRPLHFAARAGAPSEAATCELTRFRRLRESALAPSLGYARAHGPHLRLPYSAVPEMRRLAPGHTADTASGVRRDQSGGCPAWVDARCHNGPGFRRGQSCGGRRCETEPRPYY